MMNENKKNNIILILILSFSILFGILSKDYFLGVIILICGLLNSYYASIGKIYNYIFGALYSILSGYVFYKNGLYGMSILSFLIYFPSQIQGYLYWNETNNKDIVVKSFNKNTSFLVIGICIISSAIFGYFLSMIPTQNLAYLDAFSNIISICGIVLMNLKYKECWIVWLFNNTIDVIIWIINVVNKTSNSVMMLIVSICYLLINIYGIKKWNQFNNKTNP